MPDLQVSVTETAKLINVSKKSVGNHEAIRQARKKTATGKRKPTTGIERLTVGFEIYCIQKNMQDPVFNL